jgi:hypothetical protein
VGVEHAAFTHTHREQYLEVCAAADTLGDGCVYHLEFEVQVIPTCTSSDNKLNSYGGVFYQEGVEITHLLVRRIEMLRTAVEEPNSVRVSNGNDLGVISMKLWETRYPLTYEQLAQREERPPSKKAPESKLTVAEEMALSIFGMLGNVVRPLASVVAGVNPPPVVAPVGVNLLQLAPVVAPVEVNLLQKGG